MFNIIIPVFSIILTGFLFGKARSSYKLCDKLLNDYVFYIALPALLFNSVTKANIAELKQWGFLSAVLLGIAIIYILGIILARKNKIPSPDASIFGMAACYGTAGYLGIPILELAFEEKVAVPAAIATIMHNVPAVLAVTLAHDIHTTRQEPHHSQRRTIKVAKETARKLSTLVFKNPLIIAVLFGFIFLFGSIKVPSAIESYAKFLGASAGPTALFALGFSLSRFIIDKSFLNNKISTIAPLIFFKLVLHPLVTFAIAFFIFRIPVDSLWLVAAVVMAAQPIGAGVSIFASKYHAQQETVSIAVVLSILIAIITVPATLRLFSA